MSPPRNTTELHVVVAEAPDLAASTRDKYLRDLDAWIDFAGPHPSGWTRERAQAFYNGLLTKISAQGANRLMSSVSYASRWWAHKHNTPDLDFAIVRKADGGTAKARHALSAFEAQQLLATTKGGSPIDLRDRVIIVLGLETGMRRMSLEDLAFDRCLADPYPRALVRVKGQKDRWSVPLSNASVSVISTWMDWLKSIKAPSKSGAVLRRIWTELRGAHHVRVTRDVEPISASMIHNIVVKRGKLAGIANMHPHIFRHTFVTWRTEAGMTDAQIASVTAHSLTARSGALGGYKDMLAIGEGAREAFSPPWLAEWLRSV